MFQELSISTGRDLCFDLVAIGCRSRMLKQISGAGGLWNLVHKFCTASRNMGARMNHTPFEVRGPRARGIGNGQGDGPDKNGNFEQPVAFSWIEMRQLIDKLHITLDLDAIKQIALLTYNVRRSSAFRAIISTHSQNRHRYLQIMERIGKLAKFFRSAVSVIHVATSTVLRNKHIEVETVPSVS
jgi:hypothetical protein